MNLKSIIKEVIDEISSTSGGGYYTSKLGFKKVNRKKLKPKTFEPKDLWESNFDISHIETSDPKLKKFIQNRIQSFDEIESKLNELVPLLQKAKQETIDFYIKKPSFNILYSNDLGIDYLDDMIKMFK